MTQSTRSRVLIILCFFAIYVIWGSTYLLNKIVVSEIPPFYLSGLRFTLAGILLFTISLFLKKPIKVSWRELSNTAIAGFLLLAFGNGMFVWSLKYIDSGFAALEASTQSLVVLLLLWIIDGKKPTAKSILGVVLGVFGMYLLINQNGISFSDGSLTGILMIFACVLSWSFAYIFVAKAKMPSNFLVSSSYQMLFAGITLLLSSKIFNEPWLSPIAWSTKALWCMLLLIIFGSIIAFTSFNYLLKKVSPEKVSTSAYVNPVIALLLGWYFLNEQISLQALIAAAVLLTGVYFINSSKHKRPEEKAKLKRVP